MTWRFSKQSVRTTKQCPDQWQSDIWRYINLQLRACQFPSRITGMGKTDEV